MMMTTMMKCVRRGNRGCSGRETPSGASARSLIPAALAVALTASAAAPAISQEKGSTPQGSAAARIANGRTAAERPFITATRVNGSEVSVDGVIDEAVWARAQVATGFSQIEPDEGAMASERTEARVLYGDNALYVAMRAFDSEPDEIVGQLTRRDQDSYSDLLGLAVDSYFDRRTAFQFMVNPKGVKSDVYRFDDLNEDSGWDAVWDVATSRDSEGWSAEFRIPYSQLRFRNADVQTWGINFIRVIARREEASVWAPITRADGGLVSMFGELRDLRDIEAPGRLEVLPYSLARLERVQGDEADPFHKPNGTFGTLGADVKYGVTSDLTLDMTINPDFGQVEADPAQVNLTAFETFYPERRPFFLEGSSIFSFPIALGDGDEANESLFYPRRVGRSPQGRADPSGGYVDRPDRTTILGAWKLSGKTAAGWSIGAMHALTSRENAKVQPATGALTETPVEPLSNYGVLRLQKDLREGRSAIGFIGTALRRDGAVAEELDLRSGAYTGGLDFRHRFRGDAWQVSGYALGSVVTGSADAIARTQRSSARYFHRPDAEHLDYDPTRTSLSGSSLNVDIMKFAGSPWRIGGGVQARTPGFETNDAGYLRSTDYIVGWGWGGYQRSTPQGPFRSWSTNVNAWSVRTFGNEVTEVGGNVNANLQFKSFWNAWFGVNHSASALSDGVLRGGPLFRTESGTNFWSGASTDSRKRVSASATVFGNRRPESDSWSLGTSPNLRFRPSGRTSLQIGGHVRREVNDRQWVRSLYVNQQSEYVFGRIDQATVGLTARVDHAFTPTLSLQVYAQPFVSSGSYTDFKRVADPQAAGYEDRFEPLNARLEGGRHHFDLSGVDTSIDDPDFNFKQFRSNAVLRWEYVPGSLLYVVWSQGRDHFAGNGDFDFGSDMNALFGAPSDNVFMIKLSYWLSR